MQAVSSIPIAMETSGGGREGLDREATDGIPIVKLPEHVVAGVQPKLDKTGAKENPVHESPSSVFVARSEVSSVYTNCSRSNSFASAAGLADEWGCSYGGLRSSGGSGCSDSSCPTSPVKHGHPAHAHAQVSVDDLLRDSVLSFHREGPLVNPLEGQQAHAIAGWHERTTGSCVKDKMQFVTEVKGFDYGIFWRYKPDRKVFEYEESVNNVGSTGGDGRVGNAAESHSSNVSLFIQTSRSMFATWIMGFGMAGRVGFTGNYEWHEEVTTLPGWSFQRSRQARNADLRSIIAVPVAGGVVEFGSTQLKPHNLLTVQYVQKIMGGPRVV